MSEPERVRNLLTLSLEDVRAGQPPGHAFSATSLSRLFGASATGMGIYELEPGNASWPYHFEVTEEEWLIILVGHPTLRTPDGERELEPWDCAFFPTGEAGAHKVTNRTDGESVLRAGDVACFPAGAAGGHAVRNHSDAPVRYAMPSAEARYGGATVYPDSGKISVFGPGLSHRGWIGEPVDYWEGEQ